MREVFSLVGQNKSLICLIWGIWTVPGKNIIFRGKKKQPFFFFFFCMPAGIMVTSNARNLLLFLVIPLVVIWNAEGWKEEKLGTRGGEGCLCFMPVAPVHRIFVNAFQSGYNCSLCQNHKAHYGAAEREHWGENLTLYTQSFPGGSVVKIHLAMQKAQVRPLSREDPLEKEMATHSSILAWEIPWTEKPGKQ